MSLEVDSKMSPGALTLFLAEPLGVLNRSLYQEPVRKRARVVAPGILTARTHKKFRY